MTAAFGKPPKRSEQELAAALTAALTTRTRRVQLRADLAAGRATLYDVLAAAEHDAIIAAVHVSYVLRSLPAIGRAKTAEIERRRETHAHWRATKGLPPP